MVYFVFPSFRVLECMVMYGKKNSTKDKSQTTRGQAFSVTVLNFCDRLDRKAVVMICR